MLRTKILCETLSCKIEGSLCCELKFDVKTLPCKVEGSMGCELKFAVELSGRMGVRGEDVRGEGAERCAERCAGSRGGL